MGHYVFSFLIRFMVFAIAIAFATRRVPGVKVAPRGALPVVALTFGLLNTFLYGLLHGVMNLMSLWLLFFVTPFLANALLLWLADRLLKSLKIEGLEALAYASVIVTIPHLVLQFLHI